uniref:Uncharacterized protein n=1 Tax=Arundo donax TaxID=35708 RepID=A0A0A9G1Y0_ARUDO
MHIQIKCLNRAKASSLPNLTAAVVKLHRPPFSKRN